MYMFVSFAILFFLKFLLGVSKLVKLSHDRVFISINLQELLKTPGKLCDSCAKVMVWYVKVFRSLSLIMKARSNVIRWAKTSVQLQMLFLLKKPVASANSNGGGDSGFGQV